MQPALAEDAAGADGDLRLNDVITRAQRVALRIEKGKHPFTLVAVHEVPEDGCDNRQHCHQE